MSYDDGEGGRRGVRRGRDDIGDQATAYEQWMAQIRSDPSLAKLVGGTAGFILPQGQGLWGMGGARPTGMSLDQMFASRGGDGADFTYRSPEEQAMLWNPQQATDRADFERMYPGMAQVTPESMQMGADGQWGLKPAGAEAGRYLENQGDLKYDPRFGFITSEGNQGMAGGKGGSRDLVTMLAIMASMGYGSSLLSAAGAGAGGATAGAGWVSGADLAGGAMWGGEAAGGLAGLGGADAAWGVNAANTGAGATAAGEFGLSGATAGNLAGTGGLSSGGGLGLGANAGAGSLGLGSGAAGAAAMGAGSGALLTPALSTAAGIGAGAYGLGAGGAAATAPAAMGGAAAPAATATTAGGSALSRLLGVDPDLASVGGMLGSTALGLYGQNQQRDALSDTADKYLPLGEPSRARLEASYAPGFSMADQPDFQNYMDVGAQAAARATSAKVGNPVGNPGAYAEMQKYITGSLALPQLNTYRSQLGTFGQLGTNTAGAADMGKASTTGNYGDIGLALGTLTGQKSPYEGALMKLLMKNSF